MKPLFCALSHVFTDLNAGVSRLNVKFIAMLRSFIAVLSLGVYRQQIALSGNKD